MDVDKAAGQMTLDVGQHRHDGRPIIGSLKISGGALLEDELYKGDRVTVTVADADGAVVLAAPGHVRAIGFTDNEATSRRPAYTERKHTIKLDD